VPPLRPDPDPPQDAPPDRVDLEHGAQLSRAEYISAMVHFYRGELNRATQWRLRLDNTTNWAIIATGGLLTFTFDHPDSTPLVLLLGQALPFTFLWIESRRYRIFDIWRSRVRKIEENFLNPLLTRRLESPDPVWGDAVALDLSHPRFKMSRWHAMHLRLRANYLVLFVVLNVAWVAKLVIHPAPTRSWPEFVDRLGMGLVPWPLVALIVLAFWAYLVALVVIPGQVVAIRGRHWGLEDDRLREEDR